ncbi:MAG: hypothetical protein EOP49_00220 [Sphingobacteriales bacterium]|nr:MAG: hypothetical protein EOP49_00220 [Sphingobacteriales bacterium]
MRIKPGAVLPLLLFISMLFFSCKKDKLLTSGGDIRFSTDTLTFDTVFTELGSFTLGLKLFNPQDQPVNISSIRLANGDSSFFSLNVNGIPGNIIQDVELAANDSIYVFATVKIDPRNQSNPFLIEDRLIATLNGKEFSIPFYAYGQDAHYVTGDSVLTTTWLTDKPYVIIHSALVPQGNTLTIPAGCRIYLNADSRLYVLGRLITNGTKQDSVIFQGNRLDRAYFGYQGYPGEWGGIYFHTTSTGNELNWTIIKNCGNSIDGGLPFAIEAAGQGPGAGTQLTMKNCIIENSIGFGLLAFNSNIRAQNSMIHTTGTQALALLQGGDYVFDNCNFINYLPSKISHIDEPTVALLNYFDTSDVGYREGNLEAVFRNCQIYGSLKNELVAGKKGSASFHAVFDHCLIKREDPFPDNISSAELSTPGSIFNADPLFEDYKKLNFRPKAGSPLINAGIPVSPITNDLDDKPWSVADTFDIGAYKYNP